MIQSYSSLVRWPTRVNAITIGLLQTNRQDANKTDRMQTKKIGCKQKTKTCHDANKKDRMQTKKIGCKQKTKTCHDANKKR